MVEHSSFQVQCICCDVSESGPLVPVSIRARSECAAQANAMAQREPFNIGLMQSDLKQPIAQLCKPCTLCGIAQTWQKQLCWNL